MKISLCFLLVMFFKSVALEVNDEPQCYSRFDFEYKLLLKISQLENSQAELKATNNELRRELENTKKRKAESTSIYVHWGKPNCHGNGSEIVYRGFIGGRHHAHGGGTSLLCLPEEPTWGRYSDALDSYRGDIWGAEIDMDTASEGKVFEQTVDGLDMLCAVCMAPRAITHMFPGRASCPPGWSTEYTGYLMTNYRDRAHNMEYICSDATPQGFGRDSDHQNVLYLVEARCGSLPCPPYVEGREVACSVCSK